MFCLRCPRGERDSERESVAREGGSEIIRELTPQHRLFPPERERHSSSAAWFSPVGLGGLLQKGATSTRHLFSRGPAGDTRTRRGQERPRATRAVDLALLISVRQCNTPWTTHTRHNDGEKVHSAGRVSQTGPVRGGRQQEARGKRERHTKRAGCLSLSACVLCVSPLEHSNETRLPRPSSLP